MLELIDSDGNNMINYSEFLTATVTKELYCLSEKLSETFQVLAERESGFITRESLIEVIGSNSEFDINPS